MGGHGAESEQPGDLPYLDFAVFGEYTHSSL
jgi:hypothetical protein